MKKINLHKPFQSNSEIQYIKEVLDSGMLSSGGKFSNACRQWFAKHYNSENVFLTNSGTDALEMSALLLNLNVDDEVILPSYTFVSTANAFYLRGCILKFADSLSSTPNIGMDSILPLVSSRTKVIVVMHYAGIAVDMDPIRSFANDKGILVIEDAAQAIGSRYKGHFLGNVSDIGAISFHATKIISCGEGGCCLINNESLRDRAEIIYEKGTNRMAFQRHEVTKYEWQDLGSSFGMSELQAALLFSQLDSFDSQLTYRKKTWKLYMSLLKELETNGKLFLPQVPDFAEINGTHFYIVLNDEESRLQLRHYLNENGVDSAFHYLALHRSPFYKNIFNQNLPNADKYESCLLRLPIHSEIEESHVLEICGLVYSYFKRH